MDIYNTLKTSGAILCTFLEFSYFFKLETEFTQDFVVLYEFPLRTYPALGLCQIASGCSVRSKSDPNEDLTKRLFSSRFCTSSTLPTDAERVWELRRSLTEFNSSVRYLKCTSPWRKLGKNT